MPNVVRLEYPDLSTELAPNEIIFTGDRLEIFVQEDQRSFTEVESGDTPVSITGGNSDDTIVGGAGDDTIVGGTGDDVIEGGAGIDIITAGPGDDLVRIGLRDTVFLGDGEDRILVDYLDEFNLETLPNIADFQSGEDLISIFGVENSVECAVYDIVTGVLFLDDLEVVQLDEGLIIEEGDVTLNGQILPFGNPDSGDKNPDSNSSGITVYRFFDPTSGGHFYTVDEIEKNFVLENLANYTFEGESYKAYDPTIYDPTICDLTIYDPTIYDPIIADGAEQVYRFFNPSTGVHLYTTSEIERDSVIENLDNFTYEGAKFYAFENPVEGSIPVYRFYEPTLGVHFYTPSEFEKDSVIENLDNYNFEGIAYYAMPLE